MIKKIKYIFANFQSYLPYIILTSIYFFFINLEARKDQNVFKDKNIIIEKKHDSLNIKNDIYDTNIKIEIPVIPYGQ